MGSVECGDWALESGAPSPCRRQQPPPASQTAPSPPKSCCANASPTAANIPRAARRLPTPPLLRMTLPGMWMSQFRRKRSPRVGRGGSGRRENSSEVMNGCVCVSVAVRVYRAPLSTREAGIYISLPPSHPILTRSPSLSGLAFFFPVGGFFLVFFLSALTPKLISISISYVCPGTLNLLMFISSP